MLNIRGDLWEWFNFELTDEVKEATKAKRLSAMMREDGDEEAATVAAIRGVDAPDENTRFLSVDLYIGDCVLIIAWDDRFVSVEETDEEEEDEEEDED